jgi:hypothetical protein
MIWTRRIRGVVLVLGLVVSWYGLVTVVMHVGGLAVFGREWLRAMGLSPELPPFQLGP